LFSIIDPPAGEEKAIDQFATLMQQAVGSVAGLAVVKALPRFYAQFLIKTGLIHVISSECLLLIARMIEHMQNQGQEHATI